jgi:hypothetical protein
MQGYSKRAKMHKREREIIYYIDIYTESVTLLQAFRGERLAGSLVVVTWSLA